METYHVSPKVYQTIQWLSQDRELNGTDRQAIADEMDKEGLGEQKAQILAALDHQVAFQITDGQQSTPIDPVNIQFPVPQRDILADVESLRTRLQEQVQATAHQREDIQNNPTKKAIYDELSLGGRNDQEIIDTFNYLDSIGVNYDDILELVRNQQAKGYDQDDILAAVQAYGIIQESLNLDLPEPTQKYLTQVGQELKDGNLRIDAHTKEQFPDDVAGVYRSESNTIYHKQFDINSPSHRAIILHESIHASHDIEFSDKAELGVSGGFSEKEAYLVEGIYLLEAEKNGEIDRSHLDELTQKQMAFADAYLQYQNAERAYDQNATPANQLTLDITYQDLVRQEDDFENYLKQIPVYRHAFEIPFFANGIHSD